MNSKSLIKGAKATARAALKEILNPDVKTPEQAAENVSKELAKFDLKANETFQVKNPITGKVTDVVLSRTGTQESDLIIALADPNLGRDQKDHALSMYLWGRGAESSSMIVDLMRYKGTHTKETRVFKSQMRFDFEALVTSFVDHFETQARNTADILGYDLKKEISKYREWLKDGKPADSSYAVFFATRLMRELTMEERITCALMSQAIYQLDEAEKLTRARMNIAQAREREKGGGIFVDHRGRTYDATQPDIDEIVKADREASAKIEHE